MTWLALAVLALWLAGLTWYVARLALAPVPVGDIQAALQQMARSKVAQVIAKEGAAAVRARIATRQGRNQVWGNRIVQDGEA